MTRTINVGYLARVEGEGALTVKLKGDRVQDVKLRIFEPPRLFEGFLRGRHCTEAVDITARICGICPIAYQMSAVHAIEQALGVKIDPAIRLLRRLIYCGEWIESHALHVYMLHAPDFLGYQDVIEMARDHRKAVEEALELKKTGNELMTLLGGREIHPVTVAVGGFYRVPRKRELLAFRDRLRRALELSLATVRLVNSFEFPDFEQDYELVSLSHPDEYPLNEGRLVSNKGLDICFAEYEDNFVERHVKHSNALHSLVRARGAYMVGPLARFALNFEKLPAVARAAAAEAGLTPECRNPFRMIVVRAVELVFACHEAIRIIDQYEEPETPRVQFDLRSGTGQWATEAPRGLLYHRYSVDEKGLILSAHIVPPTAQNQKQMENDLWRLVPKVIELPDDQATWRCEQAIRNYDPCISCATHFLKLRIDRESP